MKRRLLCILFMLAGMLTILGVILLSLIIPRYRYADSDWTLIFISVLTIAAACRNIGRDTESGHKKFFLWIFYIVSALSIIAGVTFTFISDIRLSAIFIILAIIIAACFRYINDRPDVPEISDNTMIFLRVFRVVNILIIMVCVLFIIQVMSELSHDYEYYKKQKEIMLLILAAAGIAAAVLSLRLGAPVSARGKVKVVRCLPMAAAIIITAVLCVLSNVFVIEILFITSSVFSISLWFLLINGGSEPGISKNKMILTVKRAVSILTMLICLAFIVYMFLLTDYYTGYYRDLLPIVQNTVSLMILAAAGIAAAALSLKSGVPDSGQRVQRAVRYMTIAADVIIAISLSFVFINYMPKYSVKDGLNIVRADEKFLQKNVYGSGITESYGGNPFYSGLFQYECSSFSYDSAGMHFKMGFILFYPVTGEYVYTHTQEHDYTYSPGEWPKGLSTQLIYDFNEHRTVLNIGGDFLYQFGVFDAFHDGSGKRDTSIKSVKYPHDFPEDEAHAFLKSMSEEELKANLLKQIEKYGSNSKTIEIFFFGIDIATYQNGDVVLKV